MSEAEWDAGRYEGVREEQLRRTLPLSVRERLEGLEALADASDALAGASRLEGWGGGTVTPLEGCRSEPLASYLKALGVLRLVSEQLDSTAAGAWQNGAFLLRTEVARDEIVDFFLHRYEPTPILAPWNAGSGFFPKDNQSGIDPIEHRGSARFDTLRETIHDARQALTRLGLTDGMDGARKADLLALLRSTLSDRALQWLDAAVLLTEEAPRYPPLLGTGGNDGRLDFTNNFLQRLVELFDPETGTPRPATARLLRSALFGEPVPGLDSGAVGQFAPGSAGGPNAGTGFEGPSLVNPWDFVLMLEGAALFAAAAARRLEGEDHGRLSYPFTVRPSGIGAGNAALADEAPARAEFWAPIWERPTAVSELRTLFGEGRAVLNGRPARDGLDFVRAIARLGVERGLSEFVRYGFLQRSGKAYLATPLNTVAVRANPRARLIDELERGAWLRRFRSVTGRKGAPNRAQALRRALESALFELATQPASDPWVVQETLTQLGLVEAYLASSPTSRELCPPLPFLSGAWVQAADDGSEEFSVAAALAGIYVRPSSIGPQDGSFPLRSHLAPIRVERAGRVAWSESALDAVWGHRDLVGGLGAVLQRRLLLAERHGWTEVPLASRRGASLHAIARWMDGGLDNSRVNRLLRGLVLCRSMRPETTPPAPPPILPAVYGLLKPFFTPHAQLERLGFLDATQALPTPLRLARLLQAGRVGRPSGRHPLPGRRPSMDDSSACGLASRILRSRGLILRAEGIESGPSGGPLLLATLTVPLTDSGLRRLLSSVFSRREDVSKQTVTSSTLQPRTDHP